MVAGSHLRIVAAKPDATHRKPGVAPPLGNPGFLQQRQRSAASTDEHKWGLDLPVLTAFFVPQPYTPEIPITSQILHAMEKVDGESFLIAQRIEKLLGESPIIHIRTGQHARHGNVLAYITAFHNQGEPLLDLLLVIGIFHPTITVMGRERLEAFVKKRDMLRSTHKAEVGDGMKKGLRVFDRSLLHQIGPELTGKIELGVDLQSLGNVDTAVTCLWGVVQLTEGCMARAGVVPG